MAIRCTVTAVLAAVLTCTPAFAAGQDTKSPEIAKQLAQLLDQQKLQSFAVADPSTPGTYVATMYFPGTQLLVVSAKYAAPQILDQKLAQKDYQGVYVELQSASEVPTKIFVMDTLADGLVAKPGDSQAPDSVEKAGTQITFDGDWKKAKESETAYMKTFTDVDAAYAHAMQVLIDKLKAGA